MPARDYPQLRLILPQSIHDKIPLVAMPIDALIASFDNVEALPELYFATSHLDNFISIPTGLHERARTIEASFEDAELSYRKEMMAFGEAIRELEAKTYRAAKEVSDLQMATRNKLKRLIQAFIKRWKLL
ncbi:MAG: hypothetical protein Q9213_002341 [Squamulea squamosa]